MNANEAALEQRQSKLTSKDHDPNELAQQMQKLIHGKPVIATALADIDQGMNHPLR